MMSFLNDLLWGKLLIVVLIALGIAITLATHFMQFRYFGRMFRVLTSAFQKKTGQPNSYETLLLGTAGRVGAGNIGGVAVAITIGGPGAIFWMWAVGIIGMATSIFECTLAQAYKVRESDGNYRGGPAFYITRGLGQKWLAALFSILLIITFGFAFVALQSYTVATSIADAFNIPTHYTGICMAILLGMIIFGGVHRIVKVADVLVPIMALAYIGLSFIIILMNITELPSMLISIFRSAFGLEQAIGGGIGAAILQGVKRGLFSNEAGLGSSPNVAAIAEVKHPVEQGIVNAFGVFIDTAVICSCTAAIILLAGIQDFEGMGGVALTQNALAIHVGEWGRQFVSISLFLFAFSSIMYNYYLGETGADFFSSENKTLFLLLRITTLALVIWGSMQDLSTIFGFADITMGFLAVLNLVVLTLMFKTALRITRDFDQQLKSGIDEPVFNAEKFADLDIDASLWTKAGK